MNDIMTAERNDCVIMVLDRPRTLRLGHKALKRFSALTECSMLELEGAVQRYDKLSTLVYVMLSEDDPSLTPTQVDELLDALPIKEISEKASLAIQLAFEDEKSEEDEPEAENPPQAAGTGIEA